MDASHEQLHVLVVDDDEVDRLAVRRHLDGGPVPVRLSEAGDAGSALELLLTGGIDCALVDYRLSAGEDGLALYRRFKEHGDPGTAVVLLTGMGDAATEHEALRAGMQDYLNKDELGPSLLARSILHAVERQRLRAEIAAVHRREREGYERELRRLSALAAGHPGKGAGARPAAGAIARTMPRVFAELADEYRELARSAARAVRFEGEHDVGRCAQALAERLGTLHAGPRDVVELHTRALRAQGQDEAGGGVSRVEAAEQRYLLLEVMGLLAAFYRDRVLEEDDDG